MKECYYWLVSFYQITEFENKSNIITKILFWGEIGVGVSWHPELLPLSYCLYIDQDM